MKNSKMARLFIDFPLIKGDNINLSKDDAHYLINVMRKKQGNEVVIFNGKDGEWTGILKSIDRNSVTLEIQNQKRAQSDISNIWIIFSLIKSPRLNFLIEKSTELGVAGFIPITTDHSVVDKINYEKARSWIKESSEQSERISLPKLENTMSLSNLIDNWPQERKIIFCNEREAQTKILDAFSAIAPQEPFAIMIGPEGGFSEKENKMLKELPYVISCQMGPRILRSETAILAAISSFQSLKGDWNSGPRS